MLYSTLSTLEEKFRLTGNNGEYTLRKFAVPIPGESLDLEGFLCTPVNRSGYYHDTVHKKERIVIHYTAGNLRSDAGALTKQDWHVSVPFVIARDGTIYQLFSSKFWSGHLGKGVGNTGTGNAQDKCTIPIELSNYGYLAERDGNLETYYSRMKNSNGVTGPVQLYCSLNDTDAYQKLDAPFRQQQYYASFTRAQYDSLIILLRYLTAKYDIPRAFLAEPLRYQTTDEVLNFKGIVSHVNYRNDGKWDIGPAFDWTLVADGLTAAMPVAAPRAAAFRGAGESLIRSEDEIDSLLPPALDASQEDQPYQDKSENPDPDDDLEKSSASTAPGKVYALMVAINKYNENVPLNDEVIFPVLGGCVPDCKKMKAYLENDPSFITDIKVLTDKQATKGEIVRLFKEHLGQVKEGDVAFFFFSGHGTQEWADPSLWKKETDGKLECIVCYYDNGEDELLVADKELRFLIHDLANTGAHVVAMFDCCHSADNTRNGAMATKAFSETIEKRVPYVFPRRKWNKFIFSDSISTSDMEQKGESVMLPEGMHIQLSACESNESALEVSGEGVFTKTLLQVLRNSGGEVNYYSLESRIRQYLKNVYEQRPRIYLSGPDQQLMNSTFLNRSPAEGKLAFGELIYNEDKGWKFTLGAIHGIGENTGTIRITDPEKPAKIYEGTIDNIEIDSCSVTTTAKLDTSKVYNGSVNGLLSRTIKIHVENTDGSPKDQQKLMDEIFETAKNDLITVDSEDQADYVLRIRKGRYYITHPGDQFRPVAAPVSIRDMNSAEQIVSHLMHISTWEFLRNLANRNETDKLADDSILMEISSGKEISAIRNKEVTIVYKNQNGEWKNDISVKLTNTTSANIYCAAVYLTSDFGTLINFLNPKVYLLEPGNSVNLSTEGDDSLPLTLSDTAKFYNWKEEKEYITIIASTDLFDIQALALDPLPTPIIPGAERSGNTRGINISAANKKKRPKGWTTQTITLRLQNPLADKLSGDDISKMLDDKDTADFAKEIFTGLNKSKKDGVFVSEKLPNNTVDAKGFDGGGKSIDSPKSAGAPQRPPGGGPRRRFGAENIPLGGTILEHEPNYQDAPRSMAAPPPPPPPPPATEAIEAASPTPASPPTPVSQEGQLEYDIPGQMQKDKTYTCKVNIAGIEVDPSALKISDQSVHASIRIADEMSVRIADSSGGGSFDVVAVSTERQAIFRNESTSWIFKVTPKKSGNHSLTLKITIHINGRNKDLDILEKEVLVSTTDEAGAAGPSAEITRILFISANPVDTSPLRIGAETRKIREEIGLASKHDKFLFTINLGVTGRTLSRSILQEDPTIVHFSGHGEEEGLCLETENGNSKIIDETALGLVFLNFTDTIKCVILNACYSEPQARAIAKYIPFVIGMKKSVKDEAALAFSVGFYQALADGNNIEYSYNMGLAAMAIESPGQQDVAILLKK